VGIRDLDGDEPKLVAGLRQAVSGLGALCIGRKLGYARMAPLAIVKKDKRYIPSLTLKAVAAYQGGKIVDVDRDSQQITIWNSYTGLTKKIGFSNLEIVEQNQPLCPAIRRGDYSADIFIDLSPAETLRDPSRRYAYEEVIARTSPDELEWFKDKIVLVGVENKGDRFAVYRGLEREETVNTACC